MKIVSDIYGAEPLTSTAVAVGKFDGIHIGHQEILKALKQSVERKEAAQSVVLTFTPSPEYFFSQGQIKCITTDAEKRAVFEAAGIDVLVEFPFDARSAGMEPENFVRDILLQKLGAKVIISGDDFTFGKGGDGNTALLQEMAGTYGFAFESIPKTYYGGEPVSSTRIRQLLSEGNMEEASALMGRQYTISAVISHGRSLGRKLGMPTINQIPEDDKFLPPFGVYYSETFIDGERFAGITNIGIKPTISDHDMPVAETYLYNFSRDVYDKEAVTGFLSFRRPEHKFSSIGELEKILESDMEAGRAFHNGEHYAE